MFWYNIFDDETHKGKNHFFPIQCCGVGRFLRIWFAELFYSSPVSYFSRPGAPGSPGGPCGHIYKKNHIILK